MTSTNTAILEKILLKIEGLDDSVQSLRSDVTSLRSDVTSLRSDVTSLQTDMKMVKKKLDNLDHEFHAYTHREGRTQELIDANKFLHAWEEHSLIPAYISPFRYFFRASEDSLLTDLDGCVFINQPADMAYIIESKHAFTVDELLQKLTQFCEIIDTLKTLQSMDGSEWLANQSPKFQTMVATHDLLHFPTDIYFMIASDDMPKVMQEYIQKINKGETERNEKQQVARFHESELYTQIQQSIEIPAWVKNKLATAYSIKPINQLIAQPSSKLQGYKDKIHTMFSKTDPCFKQLQGRIGIMCLDLVIWPNGEKSLPGLYRGGKRKTRRQRT
jgi:hypothetical protein